MKRPQKILQAASEKLDIPGEVMAGLPKLSLTGFHELTVEQHKGILEYTDQVISLALGIGTVRVTGSRLAIRMMNHQYVIVAGEIANIALLPGDGHD